MNKIGLLEMRVELLKIIKESGDLENIQSYQHSNGTFTTEQGWKVEVDFPVIDYSYFLMMKIPTQRKNSVNVTYSIEGEESQYSKTTYRELIKILKTVSDIIIEYANNNPNTEAFCFFAANKDSSKLLSKTDPQKTSIYKTIVVKRLSNLGKDWKLKDVKIGGQGFNGFVIYKNKDKK